MTTQAIAKPTDSIRRMLEAPSVRQQFVNALKEHADPFIASIIDLYGSSTDLQQCDAGRVVMECLKAATLDLPLNRQLGFAWVVPYKVKGQMQPQFQLGYKGYIQLALRTCQYRFINAGVIYEGMVVKRDILTGSVTIEGEAKTEKPIGYFAYLQTMQGFSKTVYMTKEQVERHGAKYSKSFNYDSSPWKTDFDAMAQKTCIRQLISKWGYMSIEMAKAISEEEDEFEAQESIDEGMARAPVIEEIKTVVQQQPEASAEKPAEGQRKAPFLA